MKDPTTLMELASFKHFLARDRVLRSARAASLLALSLTLSACGRGGSGTGAFDMAVVAVVVAGQPTGNACGSGSSSTVYVRAGQGIELDASESVFCILYVAGTAVGGTGTAFHYADQYSEERKSARG